MVVESRDTRKRLEQARKHYEAAMAQMRQAESLFQCLGGSHPDGTQAMRSANRQLAVASAEFQRALKRFSDEILRQPLPDVETDLH